MTGIDVRTVADDVWTVLNGLTHVNTYRNEIVDTTGQPVDPPTDPDGRAHPYAVAYFDAGTAGGERQTGGTTRVTWTCQISCVGGDDVRALWAVGQVRNVLTGLVTHGGTLTEISNTMRVDTNIQPSRTVRDLIYRLQARN